MIFGHDEISSVFSLFHDGVVSGFHWENDTLELEVEIEYLAQRVDPSYPAFKMTLQGFREATFNTWPNKEGAAPAILREPAEFLSAQPEILGGILRERRWRLRLTNRLCFVTFVGANFFLLPTPSWFVTRE